MQWLVSLRFHTDGAVLQSNLIPLDGINLDTEWHRNDGDYLDGDGERMYHGVYDWDTTLYPDPQAMIDWHEARGLWPM